MQASSYHRNDRFKGKALTTVTVPLEVKPELENVVVELAPEASPVRQLPFSIHYLECNVFIWGSSLEVQNCKIWVLSTRNLKVRKNSILEH